MLYKQLHEAASEALKTAGPNGQPPHQWFLIRRRPRPLTPRRGKRLFSPSEQKKTARHLPNKGPSKATGKRPTTEIQRSGTPQSQTSDLLGCRSLLSTSWFSPYLQSHVASRMVSARLESGSDLSVAEVLQFAVPQLAKEAAVAGSG